MTASLDRNFSLFVAFLLHFIVISSFSLVRFLFYHQILSDSNVFSDVYVVILLDSAFFFFAFRQTQFIFKLVFALFIGFRRAQFIFKLVFSLFVLFSVRTPIGWIQYFKNIVQYPVSPACCHNFMQTTNYPFHKGLQSGH